MSESSFTTKLKPSQIKDALKIAVDTKLSLMVWGAPGIGKSQIAQAFADSMWPLRNRGNKLMAEIQSSLSGDLTGIPQTFIDELKDEYARLEKATVDQEFNLIDMRLSQCDPTDLRGCPVPVTYYVDSSKTPWLHPTQEEIKEHNLEVVTQTIWAPVALLNLPKDWKGILLFDELNSAIPVTQAAAYQIFLDHRIGELTFPEGAVVIAAGNRENDGGVTYELALPLRDRIIHVEMVPDVEEWLQYAVETQQDADIISYLKARSSDFNTLNPDEPNIAGGSSPRSWVRAGEIKRSYERLFGSGKKQVLRAMLEGTLGTEIAGRFIVHCDMTSKLPSTYDILNANASHEQNLNAQKIPDPTVAKFYAVVSNLLYAMINHSKAHAKSEITKAQFNKYCENFCAYIDNSFSTNYETIIIMALRTLIKNQVFMSLTEIKNYHAIVQKHSKLVQKCWTL